MGSGSCPGSDGRYVTADEVRCPECGTLVEMFSDEQRRTCPSCGTRVNREVVPTCSAWCGSARACLGATRYDDLARSGMIEADATRDDSASDADDT